MNTFATQPAALVPPLRVMPTASGHSILLSAEEFPIYHAHMTRILTEHRPETQTESELVQRIIDNEWRIARIARIEMGLYAQGSVQFASLFSDADPEVRSLLVGAHTHSVYARQLNNLSIQEARLRRYVEKDLLELQSLQAARMEQQAGEKSLAASAAGVFAPAPTPRQAAGKPDGFEFSNALSDDSSLGQSDSAPAKAPGKVTRH